SDQVGKRHQIAFKTKKEADAFLVQARHEVGQGTHTASSKSPTVADAGLAWIATALADGLERSTLRQYEQHLHLHIEPHLGATKLADLSPAAIERFRRRLHEGGRSPAMVKRAVASLGAILAHAMSTGGIARNAVRDVARTGRRHSRLEKRHQRRIEVGVDIP